MAATTAASSLVVKSSAASLSSVHSSINGSTVAAPQQVAVVRSASMTIRAEKVEEAAEVSRRTALSLFAGAAAALTLKAQPAEAAYGEAANVFGKRGNSTGFISYAGQGFSLIVPSKWNPSKEVEFPGTVVRYEDNFDAVNNLAVIINPTSKKNITDYGSPEKFLEEVSFLLGRQSYNGLTASEGGFDKNLVSTASLLGSSAVKTEGKDYYKLELLSRTADGNEGGIHQLITATISDGKLYILKVQAGDKRWFKGTRKFAESTIDSFNVA